MADEIAIRVESVSKDFLLPHEKVGSVKGLFTSMFKGRNRTKETQHALRDISFEIKEGEFFGIVGRNGSGKSTLLKILAGIYQPTEGQTHKRGKLVPFIELGVGFNPELTGRENVYLNGAMLGFSEKEVEAMYDDIVAFAELGRFMDQKLKNYSSGMQVRLAFSMATRADADILLIDEVLAVGDADFQSKCFDYFHELKAQKKTVVFVSHDMNAVREYCDRAVLIESSKLIKSGSANDVSNEYSKMFLEEAANNPKGKAGKRWGTGAISYSRVKIVDDVLIGQDFLEFEAKAKVSQDCPEALFGFVIRNAAGQNITGTNSQIEGQRVTDLKAGQTLTFKWKVPNIFSDGSYKLDPAIVLYDGQTADWWEGAATFTVARKTHTPYLVSPKVTLEIGK
ncbi:MAG TPA: ABC transporter ATP-binding protein [Candidatus Saccharimonadia bacterium]|nr:ABC transporter ATP-binding protein [Candidatus Saccharimonadia bacterium]